MQYSYTQRNYPNQILITRFSSISSNKCPQGLIYFDAIKGRIIRDSDYKMVALIY